MKRKLRSAFVFVVLIAFAALFLRTFRGGAGLVQDRHRPRSDESAPRGSRHVARSTSGQPLREDFPRRAVGRPRILRRHRPGQPELLSHSTDPSQPSELEGAGLGRRSRERLHGGLWQFEPGRLGNLAVAGYLSDVHNPTAPLALQKIYRGAPRKPTRGGSRTNSRTTSSRCSAAACPASRRRRSPT